MITGTCFIILGVCILLFPQLLVAMVAGTFIAAGVIIIAVSRRLRKLRKRAESGVADWIIRY